MPAHREITFNAKSAFAFASILLAASSASGTVINFNDLRRGTSVTTQYEGVSFWSEVGQRLVVQDGGFICTSARAAENCSQDLYISFAGGVSNLSLLAVEPNEFGTIASFYLYSGSLLLGKQDLIGLATVPGSLVPGSKLVSFAGFSGVTRLEIRGPGGTGDIDSAYGGNGIGWDNISFNSSPVPEPGTGALFLLGAAGLTMARLRRRVGPSSESTEMPAGSKGLIF